jgi:2-succinyl-5-enolpyruvyl-6-hydroxy-3-cyclohexene-1-carboxylate synthase
MIQPINSTYAPVQAFVDELARCGTTHAVTSPGSRNAPLALALAGEERIEAVSVLDERSAGYVALGMAKATGVPVAVTCTSGTAVANLMPAVAEAREARVPLVVLTADRPPELRDVGAGQAIDQLKVFGSLATWFCEVGSHPPGRDAAVHHRALACRAYASALGPRPGPVHLNFPLRDPLAPMPEPLDPEPWQGRPGGRPWVRVDRAPAAPSAERVAALAREIAGTPRGAIVCGASGEDVAEPVARLAEAAGWPVLADALSGLRSGPHDRERVVAHYDLPLRDERFALEHVPDLVLRVGDTPTSKPLRAWLARAPRQVVLDPHGAWHEPTRAAQTLVVASPALACAALAGELAERTGSVDPDWVASWRRADALAAASLEELPEPSEAHAYTALAPLAADGDLVWVGSSMPVRDVETWWPSGPAAVRLLSNRGANGIDGVVSSALGAALATGARTFLLTGELALLHDLGGLVALARNPAPLAIVCVDNGGGGIFDFLPVAEHAPPVAFERHVATPAGIDLARVAALAGLAHARAASAAEVREAIEAGARLVEVRTDRARNVALHREAAAWLAARL